MGCGKSYWSKQLSRELKIPVCDIDDIIEDKYNAKIWEIFHAKGEDYFREIEYQVLQDLIRIKNDCIVSCGGGIPCYNNNMALMNVHGITLYLKASKEYVFNNLKRNRERRPLIAKLNDVELRSFIDIKLDERKSHYEKAMYIIDIDNIESSDILKTVINCINQHELNRYCGDNPSVLIQPPK
ncbi:putative Shikimate kinase [Crenothrix polyspora]|uniref:Shikimate kinase n=2 Tax=Crenothrix polyspora TaxID=360316 RepID=A0A1R4HD46_9GAMM|nr:putative Shikimate kinase [Crenothrix polyspora]